MKNIINRLVNGNSNKLNGLIALVVVLSIALGCNCNRSFDLGNTSSNSSSSDNPFGNSKDSTANTASEESKPDATKGTVPTDGELQFLVRDTLLSFNDSIQKADFENFYNNLSKPWKSQTTPDKLKTQFSSFIEGKASFGEISDMTAVIASKNTKKEGRYTMLETKGEYSTSPIATTFTLGYIAEGSDWKLSKIEVYTGVRP